MPDALIHRIPWRRAAGRIRLVAGAIQMGERSGSAPAGAAAPPGGPRAIATQAIPASSLGIIVALRFVT
ncbi:hypothetical protein L838_2152 [Mycobacterium avium MAV_120709_2344]|nr:hypothetical protein L838_2152 [Mycobacterium avium MAV_120709_2344]